MKKLPLKVAIIVLSIFQIYTIFTKWGEDYSSVFIAIVILIGCILLLIMDIFFKSEKNPETSNKK